MLVDMNPLTDEKDKPSEPESVVVLDNKEGAQEATQVQSNCC